MILMTYYLFRNPGFTGSLLLSLTHTCKAKTSWAVWPTLPGFSYTLTTPLTHVPKWLHMFANFNGFILRVQQCCRLLCETTSLHTRASNFSRSGPIKYTFKS